MNTEELIDRLARDAPVRIGYRHAFRLALLTGLVLSVAMLVFAVGLRENIVALLETRRVLFKVALTLLLAIVAVRLARRSGQPGQSLRGAALLLFVPVSLLAAGIVAELFALPPQAWAANLIGENAVDCLVLIPLLSVMPFAGLFWVMRRGAPENPMLAGAAIGLSASAIAAGIYAWHCPDDSPLFVATWYVIAIAIVTSAGALAGRRWLRW